MRKGLLCLFLLLPAFILPAQADMGPKPELTIYVENPPPGPYYLDLLIPAERAGNSGNRHDGNSADMLALLFSLEGEGWVPALAGGTQAPLTGQLTGYPDGSRMRHLFSYVGVPDEFRIIIVTADGAVTVSDVYKRPSLQGGMTYDYATGEAAVPSALRAVLAQFAVTFPATLLIEGLILLPFGISFRKNWKPFLLVNFITQVILTCAVGITLLRAGTFGAFFIQFPAELVIMVGEALFYEPFFTVKKPKTALAYGITANLASWAAGAAGLGWLSDMMVRLMRG